MYFFIYIYTIQSYSSLSLLPHSYTLWPKSQIATAICGHPTGVSLYILRVLCVRCMVKVRI